MIDQLVRIYLEEEKYHTKKLTREEAEAYFKVSIAKGRILSFIEHDHLYGYLESWRINYDQLGRVLCHVPFSIAEEDIEHGPICYIEGVFIEQGSRAKDVHRYLKHQFFKQNYACEFFVEEAFRKRAGMLKIFKRDKFIERWSKEEVVYGQG